MCIGVCLLALGFVCLVSGVLRRDGKNLDGFGSALLFISFGLVPAGFVVLGFGLASAIWKKVAEHRRFKRDS